MRRSAEAPREDFSAGFGSPGNWLVRQKHPPRWKPEFRDGCEVMWIWHRAQQRAPEPESYQPVAMAPEPAKTRPMGVSIVRALALKE
jgi:hypothetical protein